MSKPIKREIFLHYPTIEIAKAIVYYHNFGHGWNKDNAFLWLTNVSDKPTDEGLFIHDYDIVYYKPRFLRKSKRLLLGSIRFYVEKAGIGRNIIHEVAVRGHGLATTFQALANKLGDYFGHERVSLHFLADEPRDW